MQLTNEARRKLFDLAIHAVWADQRLAAEELAATRALARVFHPDGEDGTRGKLVLGPEMTLSAIARSLSDRESALAFAVAVWVILSDGVERPCETALLDHFRLLAGVPREVATGMRRAVRRARIFRRERSLDGQLRTLVHEVRGEMGMPSEDTPFEARSRWVV